MGASLSSTFKLICSTERQQPIRSAVRLSSDSNNYITSTARSSAEFKKNKENKKKKKKKKINKRRESHDHDQPADDQKMVAKNMIKRFTLEELIMASPSRPDSCFNNGGDLHVFNHFYKRVHPSSTALSSKATDKFTLERRDQHHDIHEEAAEVQESVDSLISASQSTGKLKKKVSFKLPQEADIIVFYSSPARH